VFGIPESQSIVQTKSTVNDLKKCASGRGNDANVVLSRKAQLRAPLSPLQTAWTGFDPYLYGGRSSSACGKGEAKSFGQPISCFKPGDS